MPEKGISPLLVAVLTAELLSWTACSTINTYGNLTPNPQAGDDTTIGALAEFWEEYTVTTPAIEVDFQSAIRRPSCLLQRETTMNSSLNPGSEAVEKPNPQRLMENTQM
jgi:hypothetical protein